MAITVYEDVTLSKLVIEAGIRGRNLRKNSRVTTDSGAESINIVWTQTLREFELGTIPMRMEAWKAIEALHEVTEGGAYGFLMEDPKDMTATITEGVVQGLTSTTFQMYKRYTHTLSGRYKDRKITRPQSSGLVVQVSGSGVAYTLDDETGILTIASAPSASNVRWSGRFNIPVHFMNDSIDWTMIIPGAEDARFLSGPSVVLQEIRE